jgi:hypothetical protein
MKIEIIEPTGIRHEPFGHMQQGEIRVVPDHLGLFFVSNGWARDVEEKAETGTRGEIDYEDPESWGKARQREGKRASSPQKQEGATPKKVVQPHDSHHRGTSTRK